MPLAQNDHMSMQDGNPKWVDPAMLRIRNEHEMKQHLSMTNGLLLLNIWANWSQDCRNMVKVMQTITADLDAEDMIAFIDWQHHRDLANKLDVYGIPTLIIYAGGREVERLSGITSEAILRRYIETEKRPSLQRMNKRNRKIERKT